MEINDYLTRIDADPRLDRRAAFSTQACGQWTHSGLYVRAINGLRLSDKRVERLARKLCNVMPWIEDSPVSRLAFRQMSA